MLTVKVSITFVIKLIIHFKAKNTFFEILICDFSS